MAFNFDNKRVFLTYAQCPISPQIVVDFIRLLIAPTTIRWYVVSTEQHQDGNDHIHALLEFSDRVHTRNPRFFDLAHRDENGVKTFHPNIRPVRNIKRQVDYVTKMGDFIHDGIDLLALQSKKASRLVDVANEINKGASLRDINQSHPDLVMMQMHKLEQYINYASTLRQKQQLEEWRGLSMTMNEFLRPLVSWLNSAIKQPRPPRSKQLYLYGPPGIGKSRMIADLSRFLSIYHIPTEEPYYDSYEDKQFDLAVVDEFRSQLKIQWLNSWLAGQLMPLRKRMRSYIKTDNIPTIILSNYSPEQAFHKAAMKNDTGFQAFLDRLEVIYLETPFQLNFDVSATQEIGVSDLYDSSPPGTPSPRGSPVPDINTHIKQEIDDSLDYLTVSGRQFLANLSATPDLIDLTTDSDSE